MFHKEIAVVPLGIKTLGESNGSALSRFTQPSSQLWISFSDAHRWIFTHPCTCSPTKVHAGFWVQCSPPDLTSFILAPERTWEVQGEQDCGFSKRAKRGSKGCYHRRAACRWANNQKLKFLLFLDPCSVLGVPAHTSACQL